MYLTFKKMSPIRATTKPLSHQEPSSDDIKNNQVALLIKYQHLKRPDSDLETGTEFYPRFLCLHFCY